MKIAVISRHSSPNTRDILECAAQMGHMVRNYALSDLEFVINESSPPEGFLDYDVYLFRGYTKNYVQAQTLAHALLRRNKIVVDGRLAGGFIPSKFHEALVYRDVGIPHIATYQAASLEALDSLLSQLVFPLVVKDVDSRGGKGVRLCCTESELRAEVEQYGDTIIFQDFVDIEYDIRVLCVGDRVIGAIKRLSTSDDFRTNISLGGKGELHELTDAEQELAMSAHRAIGNDISGVDMAYDKSGRLFVIETNITPEWQGFQAATGTSVAQTVITYLVDRYETGNNHA